MQWIGVTLLQKVKWISAHLHEIVLGCVSIYMHYVCLTQCLSDWSIGAINEHDLLIEVKVVTVVSARLIVILSSDQIQQACATAASSIITL